MRILIISVMSFILTACGGSGGGSAIPSVGANISGCTDPLANNYNPSASTSDGSCTYTGGIGGGTSGNAAYYGFTTSGAEITAGISIPNENSNLVVPNEMYIEVNNKSTRNLTATIYEPTCPTNTAHYYSAILLTNTGGSQAITVYIDTYSNLIKVVSHAFRQQSVPSVIMSRYDADIGSDVSFSCSNGKITATDGTEIYANSKTLLMKKGLNLWLGFEQAKLEISNPNSLYLSYKSYNQIDASGFLVGSSIAYGSTLGQGGGDEQLNSSGFNFNNGAAQTYLGNGYFKRYGNQMSDNSSHALVIANSYAGAVATTLVANYNGTHVVVKGTPASYSTLNFAGQFADYYVGTGALSIGIGQ